VHQRQPIILMMVYLNPAMFAALILMEVLNMPKKKWYEAQKKNSGQTPE